MESYKTIVDYKGILTFKTIGFLINDLKNKRAPFQIEMVLFKKLVTLMIETLENVLKYSDHFLDYVQIHPNHQPEFHLSRNGKSFTIQSSNPIKKDDIQKVKQKIDLINSLAPDEMKLLYRETITNGEFTEKGGAGLGFMEMAKITNQPIRYNFTSLSNDFSNFELILHIRKS